MRRNQIFRAALAVKMANRDVMVVPGRTDATEFPETVVVLAPKVTRAQLVVAVKMVAMVAKAQ